MLTAIALTDVRPVLENLRTLTLSFNSLKVSVEN